jgi:ubiquinone/menaquinone biosynthesis C-methylase UbiE
MAHDHHDTMAEMLDLDAAVLHDYHREVITWAGSLVSPGPRIVDVGAGSGTGTLALARQLTDAELIAVDVDEDMLAHLRHRAAEAGLAGRIRTVRADLDGAWPDLGPVDLVWASASLHHLADPARATSEAFTALRPRGVFMITEMDSVPRFLPDPAGAALEDRCHAELARHRHMAGMHMGEDWGARLKAAGFDVEDERTFDIELRPPLPAGAGRYAQICLQRMRQGLADTLSTGDLAELDRRAASAGDDLTVRATRMAWVGRRP